MLIMKALVPPINGGSNSRSNSVESELAADIKRRNKNAWYRRMYRSISFKNLEHGTYKIYLGVVLLMNLVFLVFESVSLGKDLERATLKSSDDLVLSLVATILTSTNIVILTKLILLPTTQAALGSCAIILVLEVIYITQTVVYYQHNQSEAAEAESMTYTVVFLFLQLLSSVLLYRYWEFVLYNYDGEDLENSSFSDTIGAGGIGGGEGGNGGAGRESDSQQRFSWSQNSNGRRSSLGIGSSSGGGGGALGNLLSTSLSSFSSTSPLPDAPGTPRTPGTPGTPGTPRARASITHAQQITFIGSSKTGGDDGGKYSSNQSRKKITEVDRNGSYSISNNNSGSTAGLDSQSLAVESLTSVNALMSSLKDSPHLRDSTEYIDDIEEQR